MTAQDPDSGMVSSNPWRQVASAVVFVLTAAVLVVLFTGGFAFIVFGLGVVNETLLNFHSWSGYWSWRLPYIAALAFYTVVFVKLAGTATTLSKERFDEWWDGR